MNITDKIEAIRSKCIEVNPSIKDLVFGCEVIDKVADVRPILTVVAEDYHTVGVAYTHSKNTFGRNVIHKRNLEIIGRKIEAKDILKALRNIHGMWMMKSDIGDYIEFIEMSKYNKKGFKNEYIQFKGNDLDLQSEPTINALHALLCNEE